ncbi:MAG: 4Fe-4S dicluster domain-containing protein [archaeon]
MESLPLGARANTEVCFKCGVCCTIRARSCHVMYDRERFDPKHTFVYNYLGAEDTAGNPNIWLCVSCHKCEKMCPYEVSPVSFIETMKSKTFERVLAHSVIISEVEQVLSTG